MSLETSDFLQADDINKVFQVVDAVALGSTSDEDIENYLGLNSGSRQGRYYRLAAEKLGLIINFANNASLTPTGQLFSNYSLNNRALLAQNLIASLPVFSTVISHFRTSGQINIEDLRAYFISIYPGEESTASRRFSTFMNYIRYLGLPVQ
ncbi:DUF7226 domain-containing protein [Alkanindiges hydrocarboniclasticus]|uniref:DUF7226 domain-containing protein n=1 Tax=Alkanindiges hydrocarboniclasticus TaxID=1907941 RepID=UPI00097721B4|nr:AAA-associated domain-containing protein [Alkanindiges hydrocarboniclasticus]